MQTTYLVQCQAQNKHTKLETIKLQNRKSFHFLEQRVP